MFDTCGEVHRPVIAPQPVDVQYQGVGRWDASCGDPYQAVGPYSAVGFELHPPGTRSTVQPLGPGSVGACNSPRFGVNDQLTDPKGSLGYDVRFATYQHKK